ncbi:MAG: choice-of-anchor Q domain-containing protein, partial [Planctomycetota bacterium]
HGNEIWNNDNSSVNISYSDVRCVWPGPGNIAADPLFVNPGGVENFRLAESSPCIDTGDPNYIPESNETDFDGFPRIVGGRIDMGVYEFQGRLILYVDNDAPGSNDGSSWINAYNCLQDALIPADPTGGPVEIRVAEGIYKPDQGAAVTPGDRQASFWVKTRVTVKGGYAGFGEPDPNARDIKLHETILSGDLAGDDGLNFENNDENSYNVVTGGALGETTILDGFTITGGNANGFKSYNTEGGGIWVFPDINFTIKNCTIIRNRAKYNGGGIHSLGSSGCCFPITNCRFIANSAGSRGGAISLDGESLPNISNCVFAGNSAEAGCAIGNIEGYPRIRNCTFTGNRAQNECDAVIDYDGKGFENCILWANIGQSPQPIPDCYGGYYSCIQGWTGTLGGIGNINEDPLFVDPGYWNANGTPDDANDDVWVDGDYHLLPGSLCIDTGDPNYIAGPNETDLDDKPRVINGRIDMGAYEFLHVPQIIYVDDDAPDDPGPGDPIVSDPLEDGTQAHPFDVIQEAIDAAYDGDTIIVIDGTYTGTGNRDIDFNGKPITLRSENGPQTCIIDCQTYDYPYHRGFYFHNAESEYAVLEGFTILNGMNGSGGGIYCADGASPTIRNNIIEGNRVSFGGDGGGGIACKRGASPVIVGNVIRNNYCEPGGGGGGIHCYEAGSPLICYNVITGNHASGGGGIEIAYGTNAVTIVGNLIVANDAKDNGAIQSWATNCDLTISNNTIVGNVAEFTSGGIDIEDTINTAITNCIIWGNRDQNGTIESSQITGSSTNYSCIQGWTGALGGTGNIGDDPLFADPDNDDYHLRWDSACINTGDPDYIPEPNETDLDGKPRVIGGRIDMGAYEAPIFAETRIVPRTINLASKGKSITCYIRLPEGYNVADIDPNSVMLERQIKAEQFSVDEHKQVATATFDREKVQSILNVGDIELKITCQLTDGTYFKATDIVQVTDKGPK